VLALSSNILPIILSVACFWLIVYILSLRHLEKLRKKGIEVYPLGLFFRTSKFNEIIYKIGRRYSKYWHIFFDISILIGFFLMVFIIYFLHVNLYSFIYKPAKAQEMILIIPGVTIGWNMIPYLIIAIIIAFIVHELAHGIAAASEDIPIVSSGFAVILFLLAGFVELDENKLKLLSTRKKLRILSAGSFANFLVVIITWIFLLTAMWYQSPRGVLVVNTIKGYPAEEHLLPGDIILSIDNHTINTISDLSRVLSQYKPGEKITIKVLRNNKVVFAELVLGNRGGKAFIGIEISQNYLRPLPENLILFAEWIYVINFSVATLNMLPIIMFDGERIVEALIEKIAKEDKLKKIMQIAISAYFFVLLGANIAFSMVR